MKKFTITHIQGYKRSTIYREHWVDVVEYVRMNRGKVKNRGSAILIYERTDTK